MQDKSHFLFGPRQTGKTRLIKAAFDEQYPIIDLLKTATYLRLEQAPWELEDMLPKGAPIAIIDEVQRIPILLNEVHRLIEERGTKFLLTGSSARRLKRSHANMLGGRAWKTELFPLVSAEITNFDFDRYLLYGGLPSVYLSTNPEHELEGYVDTYLHDEIRSEAMVRNLPIFIRFLTAAALTSGQIINYNKIASDLQISPHTVKEYYSILEDTLLGFAVPVFTKTIKRKAISSTKFYLFDLGVRNFLCSIKSIPPKTEMFGDALEHFILLELRAYLSYYKKRLDLCFWRTINHQKVDFIIGDELAIEIKATEHITSRHLKGLQLLREEGICKQYFMVCLDRSLYEKDGIRIYHWRDFLGQLWDGKII
jgi:predicted AAA+ superfamily ATPase